MLLLITATTKILDIQLISIYSQDPVHRTRHEPNVHDKLPLYGSVKWTQFAANGRGLVEQLLGGGKGIGGGLVHLWPVCAVLFSDHFTGTYEPE